MAATGARVCSAAAGVLPGLSFVYPVTLPIHWMNAAGSFLAPWPASQYSHSLTLSPTSRLIVARLLRMTGEVSVSLVPVRRNQ